MGSAQLTLPPWQATNLMPVRLDHVERPFQLFLFVFLQQAFQLSMDFLTRPGATPQYDDAGRFGGL